jgi:hypothetical protein
MANGVDIKQYSQSENQPKSARVISTQTDAQCSQEHLPFSLLEGILPTMTMRL